MVDVQNIYFGGGQKRQNFSFSVCLCRCIFVKL